MMHTAWTHIRRSPYQALSAILVLILTFFVISFVAVIIFASESTIRYFESKPQITFFLKDDAQKTDISKMTSELKNDPAVLKIKYISKDDALKLYRKQFEKDPILLEMVTSSILPASIEVSTVKVEDLQLINDAYKNNPIIEEVVYQKDIVANLSRWAGTARKIGFGYIGFHLILSFFVIMTIISMKIALKKEEIEIMQLLGATRSYIRIPFILEGMFYGFFGSLIASLLFSLIFLAFQGQFSGVFASIGFSIFDPLIIGLYFSSIIIFGLIVGWFSSMLAVFRFLK